MLIGSGGVVALVVGAWAALWAVRRVPGRSWRTWYPTVVAFLAGIFAFAMLTGQSQVGMGLGQWARASAAERPEVVAITLFDTWRPLLAGLVAILPLAVAILAVRTPVSPFDERPPHWLERLAVAGMIGLMLFDGAVWLVLRRAFVTATAGREMYLVAASRIQFFTLLGAVATVALMLLAVSLGLWREIRHRRA
jgi:hypothetical protein